MHRREADFELSVPQQSSLLVFNVEAATLLDEWACAKIHAWVAISVRACDHERVVEILASSYRCSHF
jgi:hypothetical protein